MVDRPVGRFDVHPAALSWRHRWQKSTRRASSAGADASGAGFALLLARTGISLVTDAVKA